MLGWAPLQLRSAGFVFTECECRYSAAALCTVTELTQQPSTTPCSPNTHTSDMRRGHYVGRKAGGGKKGQEGRGIHGNKQASQPKVNAGRCCLSLTHTHTHAFLHFYIFMIFTDIMHSFSPYPNIATKFLMYPHTQTHTDG